MINPPPHLTKDLRTLICGSFFAQISRETNILQFFLFISILYQSYITLQSPFVGYFYFVDFQIFSTLQSHYNQKY